ncbi:uncharacterized protein PV06_02255 [Exophiala oligosperma]|uniref:Carboxylic ester hydrolase n=1 Tax=Exophiala oligosperma TaxID=215243 RepID=A0A0D2DVH6_9EURO|nr:uncharacterized protein PV06_02255 [Exophiala oligosperma]KIW46590.1 hypothetical protein PV06_02255 [Exophiala oligosperma]
MGSVEGMSQRPKVHLNQGTILGIIQPGSYPDPIEAFLGIPYAQPPVEDLRFRPPVRIEASSQTFEASRYGPAAPAKQLLQTTGPALEYSEDCLTVNVFRQKIPHVTNGRSLLPVAVYVHGGAFNRGTSAMHNTASMVGWSEQPFIAVSFNYRVGALGFLPSSLSAKEGALNLGLKDQILLFQWVQDNIEHFGGDKNDITLIGLSAGAHSIGRHLMRHNKQNPGPFHRVIIESGAPTSRAVRAFDAEIHEDQFREFLKEVGCPNDCPENEIFPFLRSLPLSVISGAQNKVFDRYNPSLRWAFQPVVDGEVIPSPPIESWRSGNYCKVPIMTGFNGNEGSLYVNQKMSSGKQFTRFFRTLLPGLTDADIETISTKLYPDPDTSADQTFQETRQNLRVGSQYKRLEAAYGQYAYVAPVRQTAHFASDFQTEPVFLYHWALPTTVVGGASHADNMRYETYDPQVTSLSESQNEISGFLHAYVTSFVCNKGDPNALRGRFARRPKWEPYQSGKQDLPKTMVFGRNIKELVGGANDGQVAEFLYDDWALEQCRFWWDRVELTQQ